VRRVRGEWEDRDSLVESVVSLVCRTDLVPEPDDPVAGVDEHRVDLDVPVRTHRPLQGLLHLLQLQDALHDVDLRADIHRASGIMGVYSCKPTL
jgi:hypothetical protein